MIHYDFGNNQNTPLRRVWYTDYKEDAFPFMRHFALGNHYGTSFALLMQEKEFFRLYETIYQPCYGELRTYGQNSSRPNDPRPGDLTCPFPEKGNPIAVAVPWDAEAIDQKFAKYALDPEVSPWRSVLKDFEVIKNQNGFISGLLIKNTAIDPTTMVHLFRRVQRFWKSHFFAALNAQNLLNLNNTKDFHIAYILFHAVVPTNTRSRFRSFNLSERVLSNIANGTPALPMEGTFFERTAYNRPLIDFLFEFSATEEKEERFSKKFEKEDGYVYKDALPEMIEAIKELIK